MQTGKTTKFSIAASARQLTLIIALAFMPLSGMAAELSGLVVSVSDGDTIKVLDDSRQQHSIRLMGIDAPEKAQPFGQRSKQSLSDLIYRQRVSVEWSKQDKYGRIVGKVLNQEGRDICLEQISRGMAWHYIKYASEQSREDRGQYAAAEEVAREAKVGLWQDDAAMPPWVWRHR